MIENIEVGYAPLDKRQVIVPYNIQLDGDGIKDFLIIPGVDKLDINLEYTKAKMQVAMELINQSTVDNALWKFSLPEVAKGLQRDWSNLMETIRTKFDPLTIRRTPNGKEVALSIDVGKLFFDLENYYSFKTDTEERKRTIFANLIGNAITSGIGNIRFPHNRKARMDWIALTAPVIGSFVKVDSLQII